MEGEVKAIQVRADRLPVVLACSNLDGVIRGVDRWILTHIRTYPDAPHHPSHPAQKDAETKMKKSVESVENNLKAIRTGRAS